MSLRQKVSSAIRILRWNRDVSARASHLVEVFNFQAGSGNVSGSTFSERKNMSTKTSFKRIAAVAAVALALGGFSAVSANAVSSSGTPVWAVTATSLSGVGTTAGTQVVGGYATLTLTETTTGTSAAIVGSLTSAGVGSIGSVAGTSTLSATVTGGSATATFPTSAVSIYSNGTAASGEVVTVSVYSAVAGTQTLTFTPISSAGAPGTAVTATITWGDAPVINAAYTAGASFIADGAVVPTSPLQTASGLAYPKTADGSVVATIGINVKDAKNLAINGQPLTVSVSGPGLITLATGSQAGVAGLVRAQSLTATTQATTNLATVGITADGTAGTSVITVASGTTTLFTKTVTFYGTVSAIKVVSQNLKIAKASTAGGKLGSNLTTDTGLTVATTAAVELEAVDANGSIVPGLTITAKSADTSVIASGAVSPEAGDALTIGANGAGYYIASVTSAPVGVSGKSTTVTFRTLLSDGVTYVTSDPVTFTLGGSIAKMVLSTDVTSYSANAPVKLTVTATDSSGNPAYDQTVTAGTNGSAGLIGSLISSTFMNSLATPSSIVGGVGSKTGIYAPIVGGDFTISGVDNASLAGEALSVSATSVGGSADAASQAATDAAQEATDAANAAYDAANNAMDSADAATAAAQDASDNASAALAAVTSLSATVAKLVSSVTAIATALAAIKKKLGVK